jgi:heme A synthase
MPSEPENARPKAGRYQTKKRRWPMRILVAALSVAAMLGLWQFVANEPAAAAQNTPSMQDAEQQLQLSNNSGDGSTGWFSNQNAPSAPNAISGQS